ncbi:MAG: hypothetical protein DRP63_04250 [Planctomycetota bacterium]|nr:MAG: hypothetical protein DRP63_04250 [Planctomycetota bacterium]
MGLSVLVVAAGLLSGAEFRFDSGRIPEGWRFLERGEGRRSVASNRVVVKRVEGARGGALLLSGVENGRVVAISPRFRLGQGLWRMRWRWRCKDIRRSAYISLRLENRKAVTADNMRIGGTDNWRTQQALVSVDKPQTASIAVVLPSSGTLFVDEIVVENLKTWQPHPLPKQLFVRIAEGNLRIVFSPVCVRLQQEDWVEAPKREIQPVLLGRGGCCSVLFALRSHNNRTVQIGVSVPKNAALDVEVYRVCCVPVDWEDVYAGFYRCGYLPDPLIKTNEVTLKAGKTASFLVWLHAADNAQPAEHRIGFTFFSDGKEVCKALVPVKVCDVEIERRRPFVAAQVRLKYLCRRMGVDYDEAAELVRRLFHKWKVEPTGLVAQNLRRKRWLRLTDNKVMVNWRVFDAEVERHLKAGFRIVSIPPGGFRARHPYRMRPFLKARYGTKRFWYLLGDFLTQVAAHLNKKQFRKARFFFYPWDEPSPPEYEEFKRLVRFFKNTCKGAEVWCAAGGVPNPKVSGMVDLWFLNLRRYNACFYRQAMENERRLGVRLGCYANDRYNLALPLLHMRLLGLVMAHLGFEGLLWYEVCGWRNDPWKEPSGVRFGDAGSGFLLYPDKNGRTLHPSLRWFTMLEAVNDASVWKSLANKIAETATKLNAEELSRNPLIYYFRAMLSGTLAGQFRNDPILYQRLRTEAFRRLALLQKQPLAVTRIRRTGNRFEILLATEEGCNATCNKRPFQRSNGLLRISVKEGLHRIRITKNGKVKVIERLLVTPY